MVKFTIVYVGSLKYSPIYKSHCCAFGRECEKKGYFARYLFSREYEWMLSEEIKKKTIFIGSSRDIASMMKDTSSFKNRKMIEKNFSEDYPSYIYMHNYHPLNHYIAGLSKKYGGTFIYHVHEPYVQTKKAHGGFYYWLYLFEYLQGLLLENTDIAITSSDISSRLFDLRYPNFSGKKMLIPLMYEDLGGFAINLQNRKYITFVGPPVPAKNPEKFLEIVRHSNESKLGLDFLLISRCKIKDSKYYREENLEIFFKERITDEEFGELIKRSIAVLTPYKRETQSSVILVSYMYGTPVVSSNVGGLPEFVSSKTGCLVDVNGKIEEWIEGINYVRKNFPKLSKNCKEYFIENFSEKNWEKYLDDLLI